MRWDLREQACSARQVLSNRTAEGLLNQKAWCVCLRSTQPGVLKKAQNPEHTEVFELSKGDGERQKEKLA